MGTQPPKFSAQVYWATVCKTVRPMPLVRCLSVCPVCLSMTLVYCNQTVGWIKMKLGVQVGFGLHQRSTAPNFRPVCCGQMAGWIQMPLGMEVYLGPGDHFVLDANIYLLLDHSVRWTQFPSRKKGTALPHPIFGPCLLWPNGWMDQDATN